MLCCGNSTWMYLRKKFPVANLSTVSGRFKDWLSLTMWRWDTSQLCLRHSTTFLLQSKKECRYLYCRALCKPTEFFSHKEQICFSFSFFNQVGVIGRTGAGKSSILNALFRLTPICSGDIMVDGINIYHLPIRELRSRLAVVPQSPFLFQGSLRWEYCIQ